MEELILKAQERDISTKGNLNNLRKQGIIPAILYGEKGKNKPLEIKSIDLSRLMHGHHIENAVLKLEISKKDAKEKTKSATVMIKEIQYHPVSDKILHIDFYQISLTKAVKVKVPVGVKGEAVGVKQDGGTLEHILWEIEIECLPADIPKSLELDISNMKIGDAILVKDIKLSNNIKLLSDPEATVLSVAPPAKEEVAAPAEELVEGQVPQEPEVIREKKPKAEEIEAAEAGKKEEKSAPGGK